MEIIYSSQAGNFLKKCPVELRNRIAKKLKFYSLSPDPLEFAEWLTEDAEAPYRYRIGDWRVKFAIENEKMVVKRIGRRDKIYNA